MSPEKYHGSPGTSLREATGSELVFCFSTRATAPLRPGDREGWFEDGGLAGARVSHRERFTYAWKFESHGKKLTTPTA